MRRAAIVLYLLLVAVALLILMDADGAQGQNIETTHDTGNNQCWQFPFTVYSPDWFGYQCVDDRGRPAATFYDAGTPSDFVAPGDRDRFPLTQENDMNDRVQYRQDIEQIAVRVSEDVVILMDPDFAAQLGGSLLEITRRIEAGQAP